MYATVQVTVCMHSDHKLDAGTMLRWGVASETMHTYDVEDYW